MSYFEKTQIAASDSPSIDAFARWRVSSATTIFDNKQLYDTGSLWWSTKIIGNASASYVALSSGVSMSAEGNSNRVVRQTKRYFGYQPGKSQLIVCTANLRGIEGGGCIKRVGYFNSQNGLFFSITGSQFGICLRKNSTDIFISQSNWNLDKFDGTGASKKTIDINCSQIYFIDFEWLGVGRIRYGIFQAGIPYYVHEITNINTLQDVYMNSPNLPVCYELINSGSTVGNMLHICSAVISEGGYESTGITRTIDTGLFSSSVNPRTEAGILAIRLKSNALNSTVIPQKISVVNLNGVSNWGYTLLLNPITSSAWAWSDIPNSSLQFSSGSTPITSSLIRLMGGYVSATGDAVDLVSPRMSMGLGSDIDGNPDTLVLSIKNLGNTAQIFIGSISVQEE